MPAEEQAHARKQVGTDLEPVSPKTCTMNVFDPFGVDHLIDSCTDA